MRRSLCPVALVGLSWRWSLESVAVVSLPPFSSAFIEFFRNVGGMQGLTSWGQGMSGGSTGTQPMPGAAQNSAGIQQPAAGMMAAAAYPMQQFQVDKNRFLL